jgi:hypothetical protein
MHFNAYFKILVYSWTREAKKNGPLITDDFSVALEKAIESLPVTSLQRLSFNTTIVSIQSFFIFIYVLFTGRSIKYRRISHQFALRRRKEPKMAGNLSAWKRGRRAGSSSDHSCDFSLFLRLIQIRLRQIRAALGTKKGLSRLLSV